MSDDEALISFKPKNKEIKVPTGTNLIDVAEKLGIIIPNICGKTGKCGKCKVRVLNQELGHNLQEEILLSPEERKMGIHLACQIDINSDLTIEILDEEHATISNFLTYDLAGDLKVDDHIKKINVELLNPTIENQIDDLSNLENSLSLFDEKINLPLPILQNISSFLRKHDFNATLVVEDNQLLSIEPGDSTSRLFGVAIDLGTTTVVGSLVDMLTGKVLAVSACTNPQTRWGADVISRVNFATKEPGGLGKLQSAVIDAINEIVEALCHKSDVNFREISELSFAGNTIMTHLFLGVTPQFIAEAPYVPVFKKCQKYTAEELGITIHQNSPVVTLPNISGYVGGDITGFILASEIHHSEKIILGIDIGTNGEIVLGSKERLLCCSTAAGPAFEGGHINSGMRASVGAIDKFSIGEDQAYFHVVGETAPKGICGTGLVDVVAELRRVGIIDETGKIVSPESGLSPDWLKKCIEKNQKQSAYILFSEIEPDKHKELKITQQDIREIQLAKGAVGAGISILCKELGISVNEIEKILIAGAFGSYMNKYNAQKIGLIPDISIDKVTYVGNAASLGAKKFLLSKKTRIEARQVVKNTEYIELSSRQDFQDIFAEKMLFV